MQESRGRFIAIVVVSLALAYVVAPIPNKPMPGPLAGAKINPGIDIAGGAEMTYRLLPEPGKKPPLHAAQTVVDVLQKRINTKGLKEPRIQTQGDDMVTIQIPGVDQDGLEDYKRLISSVGKLELKKVSTREVHEQYNQTQVVPDGCEKYPVQSGRETSSYPWIQTHWIVEKEPVITGPDIAKAVAEPSMQGGWEVDFELTDAGAKKFDDAAIELNRRTPAGHIAIIIDGELKSAPVVQAEAYGGRGQITGGFTEEGARELAIVLRSGSLPVPIGRLTEDGKPVSKVPEAENFVGPSLGQDAIMRGLLASLATIVGIAVFMIVYYRAGGVVAFITIILNIIYLMAIMAFFNATLTLPGIAGIALTLGMAVDANILIYERMREELDKGKTLTQAFDAGHDRAFVTIIDSNVTTLLAGIVLYVLGTGAVRGFAITLCIGIITTLVSVLFCGKTILGMLIARGSIRRLNMMRLMATPRYNYSNAMRPVLLGSIVAVIGLMAVFLSRGERNFGIDFRGGSRVNFVVASPQNIDTIRDRVHSIQDNGKSVYHEAEIQTMAEPGATLGDVAKLGAGASRQFQLRDQTQDVEKLKADLQNALKDILSQEPILEVRRGSPLESVIGDDSRAFDSGPAGAALILHLQDDGKFDLEATRKKVAAELGGILDRDDTGAPEFRLDVLPDAPKGLIKLRLLLAQRDVEKSDDRIRLVREKLKSMGAAGDLNLSRSPFLASTKIGPTVAHELKNRSIWAMVVSWALMIGYIAIRFSSWRFGVAAVVALVHDSLIAIGLVALLAAIVPREWGLSFDMNMTFVAAILTVIGYSINDKIVIFDRVRENLAIMKKESFAEISNTSINQTLSRTILTGGCVLLAGAFLYIATATSGGGIAEFALPLVIGVVAGTYSSIYVAMPIVLWWYGKEKPQIV